MERWRENAENIRAVYNQPCNSLLQDIKQIFQKYFQMCLMWQIKSFSSWGEGKAKTNHLPKLEGRLVPVLVLEMEFLSPEGWHYLFIKCMIWKCSFPSSRRFCRRQLKGSANAAAWSHCFRFLPKHMNSVMLKWLRFSYFVLSWLFFPKDRQQQPKNSQACEWKWN